MRGFGPDATRVLFELWAWLLVLLLSALGIVGNLALYKLGQKGEEAVASRFPRIDPARWKRAGELFKTRGSWILLLSCLPGLGIVLSTAAGAYGVKSLEFLLWAMVAKVAQLAPLDRRRQRLWPCRGISPGAHAEQERDRHTSRRLPHSSVRRAEKAGTGGSQGDGEPDQTS